MSEAAYEAVTGGWSPDLKHVYPPSRFHFTAETGSTNDDLLRLLREGNAEHLTTVQADHQTSGRGRRGDRWIAPAGANLLFSVALRLPADRTIWTRLPHLTAYLVGTAVESILPGAAPLQAKWPNDLLVAGRKLGGILVETVMSPTPFAVVGVGLNVNMKQADFPDELKETSTSIYELLGCESSRSFLLGLILQGFIGHFPQSLQNFAPVHTWLEERNFLSGKCVRVIGTSGTLTGTGRGLGPGGELLLELETGALRSVISSEKIELC